MLGLKIDAPLDGVLELSAAVLEYLDRLGVAHAAEVVADDVMQSLKQALIDKGVEELHLLRAALHGAVDDILDHRLGGVHIIVEVDKGHLRLDHPELGGVALGIGDLGAEGGAEGIDITESHGEVLGIELAGDGQARRLAEEVLAVVNSAVLLEGEVVEIERGDAEHLTRALAVGAGDDGGVDVHEAALLEKLMHCLRRDAADAESGGEEIGARSEVLDSAQELHAVALLLEGIVRRGRALDGDLIGFQLKGLLCLRGENKRAVDDKGSAYVLLCDLFVIIQ